MWYYGHMFVVWTTFLYYSNFRVLASLWGFSRLFIVIAWKKAHYLKSNFVFNIRKKQWQWILAWVCFKVLKEWMFSSEFGLEFWAISVDNWQIHHDHADSLELSVSETEGHSSHLGPWGTVQEVWLYSHQGGFALLHISAFKP